MNRTLACAVLVVASCAVAQPHEPHTPFEPPPVDTAQNWLTFSWYECRRDAYPADPEADVAKMSSTVTFKLIQGQYQGELRIGFHTSNGEEVAPNRLQSAFAACVKRQFESRRLGSWVGKNVDGTRRSLDGTRMALTNPFGGSSVVVNGQLGRARAVEVISHQLELARAHCGTAPGRVTVVVDITPEGQPATVSTTGAPATKACLEKRLMKTLRFPVVASPTRVEVPLPAPTPWP